jgi:putative transposase
MRLRELAASRVRFGYRRLTVILRREGGRVNPQRIDRLYTADELTVRAYQSTQEAGAVIARTDAPGEAAQ